MTREPNKTNFTLLLRHAQGFEYPIRCVALLWIVIVNDLMNLPNIQMIGLKTGEDSSSIRMATSFLRP